ncbi:uncharacterized protein T551_02486 [Pneumocystis jirovecii RU7]|uniref:MIF4G domain-containing protein n=1 Tax=Pneumocystis jirovecii (strain RU7) TaxID=1408657 RepID=A0A0W4ZJT8_PNEJ7|nr:uncharacterized protein T551_02486 [Pneumocystis jirovecii RU7]KTW28636.1 hypothetical protein T551_02486 [Pneumocystis jirovecii RU7]
MEPYEREYAHGTRKRYRGNYDWGSENHKRVQHTTEETVLNLLRKHVLLLGDPVYGENIESVAQILIADFEDETLHNGILSTFRDYIIELPMKIPFLATVVSLASTKEASIGKYTVEYMSTAAQAFLDSGEWRNFKLILRFLVCATSMIDGDGVMHVLNGLTQRISEIYTIISDKGVFSNDSYADELAYIFLITVPYVIARFPENSLVFETLFSYMDRIEPYMKYRSIDISLLQPFIETDPSHDSGVLEDLWDQVQYIKNDRYNINVFLRPWVKFETQLANTPKFILPSITIPEKFYYTERCYFPGPVFRIFINQPIETVPSSQTIASSVIRDVVEDIIDIMEFNRKEAARFLADLSCYFAPNLFVSESLNEINNQINTLSEWKSEDIILETIFGRLFRLPKPLQRPIYYHSLLIELCKLIPKRFAPSLGYTIRYIYKELPRLNGEILYRFWSWFSHHLSNFNFSWKWDEWVSDLELDSTHPKKVFIRETIEKEIRLSYYSKIKDSLPQAYHILLPGEPSGPYFDYDLPNSKYFAEVETLLETMKVNTEQSETDVALEIIEKTAAENNEEDPQFEALKALVQCVLHLGAKSFSNALNTIERNLPGLRARCNASKKACRQTIDIIMKFWKDQPGIAVTLIDKFLNYSIINIVSIIEWVFLDVDIEYINRGFIWELMKIVLDKINSRVIQTKRHLKNTDTFLNDNSEDLLKYEKTYKKVFSDQKDVLIAIFEMFPKLYDRIKNLHGKSNGCQENGFSDNQVSWQLQWVKGLFEEFVRKCHHEISNLSEILEPIIQDEYAKEIFEKAKNLDRVI